MTDTPCKLPPKSVPFTTGDGHRGEMIYDGCTGKLVGSFIDDPTPAARQSLTAGVPLEEPAGDLYGPVDHRLDPSIAVTLVVIAAALACYALWRCIRARITSGATTPSRR